LHKGKQGLTRAVDGQDLRGGIHLQAVAALHPIGKGLAQARFASGGWIGRKATQAFNQRLLDERWRGMAGFADAQADGAVCGGGGDVGKQLPQPFEGVGLQSGKQGIHGA
jgi:hypothetical protein